MSFVNREDELDALRRWWARPGHGLGLIWGRRRVGKTALLEHFAEPLRAVFHTGSRRPVVDELRALSEASAPFVERRDLRLNPFRDWADALESLAGEADEPLLLILDEFPELVATSPELPSVLRAVLDRAMPRSKLRVLLCGSAVRTMEAMMEERAPLYGRIDPAILLHPFRPHEAAQMLHRLPPEDRALVWGIVGGVPLYLQWWDPHESVRANLVRLACQPGAPLLTEGHFVLATEGESGELSRQVLHAIAAGRTKHNEIADAVRADPTRTLDRLVELRLLERLTPVTEDPRRTRRRLYRISDNFLAFWLGVLDRYRPEIDRGLGKTIVSVLMKELDDHMGPRYEEAFRAHLRRLAAAGALGDEIVAVGPHWTAADPPGEIDAVVLAGRRRVAVLAGEAKWSKQVDGDAVAASVRSKLSTLPRVADDIAIAVCARMEIRGSGDYRRSTARDIFS